MESSIQRIATRLSAYCSTNVRGSGKQSWYFTDYAVLDTVIKSGTTSTRYFQSYNLQCEHLLSDDVFKLAQQKGLHSGFTSALPCFLIRAPAFLFSYYFSSSFYIYSLPTFSVCTGHSILQMLKYLTNRQLTCFKNSFSNFKSRVAMSQNYPHFTDDWGPVVPTLTESSSVSHQQAAVFCPAGQQCSPFSSTVPFSVPCLYLSVQPTWLT